MKYLPLDNQPNVSRTRFESVSPSMQLDGRGYPHVAWMEEKNGTNEISYSFWDGLKWSYLGTSKVYISEEEINPTPNALVLNSNDEPQIVFSRRLGEGSRLSLATFEAEWVFKSLDVTYDIGWVGIVKRNSEVESSSSSSGTTGGGEDYYVVVYDITNSEFKVYSVTDAWLLVGIIAEATTSYSTIKISMSFDEIVIAFIEADSSIEYNFFDVVAQTWSFVSFTTLPASELYGDISDMDLDSYYTESLLSEWGCISWLSGDAYKSYVNSAICYPDGSIIPTDSVNYNVEVNEVDVVVSSTDYSVNGYKQIGVTLEDSSGFGYPRIVCLGTSSKTFTLPASLEWVHDVLDIEAVGNGNVFTSLCVNYFEDVKIVFGADSGDIYYFEPSTDETFPIANPEIILLNDSDLAYRLTSFNPSSGEDILGLYNNKYGRVLREAKMPLFITSNR